MQYLYVCLFSNGHIKAGRSFNPDSRISSHEERVSCLGVELVDHRVFPCVSHVSQAEAEMLRKCSESAEKVNKSEWFVGLDFLDACDFAERAAKTIFQEVSKTALKSYLDGLTTVEKVEFAEAVGTTVKHLVNASYGYRLLNPVVCVCIERVTNNQVTRSDLRPSDAHLIWPDIEQPI